MNDATALGIAGLAIAAAVAGAALRPAAIVRHATGVLAVLALVSATAVWALVDLPAGRVRVRLDPSEEPMLPANAPSRLVYAEAVQNFGDDDLYVVGMTTQGVFTRKNLRALRELSDAIRRLPGVRSAESLVRTTTYDYRADEDLIDVGPFIESIPSTPAELEAARARATSDRILAKTIVSQNGRTAAINVSFQPMTDGRFVEARLDESILALIEGASAPGRRFFVTGRKHIKARAYHLMVRDLLRLIPMAIVAGTVVAWALTGSLRTSVLPVGASLVATLWSFGMLAILDRPLNIITLVLAPMLICVGSVYGVHVLARYDEFRETHDDPDEATLACLTYTRTPVLIAGVTTCIGFSALLLSDTPAIAELGAFSVLGIASVTLVSLTGLPALVRVLDRPAARGKAEGARPGGPRSSTRNPGSFLMRGVVAPLLDRIARLATRRPRFVIGMWGVAALVALAVVPRIEIDTDYLTFFDQRSRVRRDFAAMNREIVGPVPIYVTLSGSEEGVFREPANLRAVRELQRRIDAIEEVSATLSIVDLVEVLNRVMERDDPAAERIPDSRGEVADLLFLIPKNKLRRFANANHSRVNILVRTGSSGSAAVLDLERRLWSAIESSALPPDVVPHVTGNAIVLNEGADGIARDQLTTVGVASAAILLVIARAFRSVHLGALAMVPNLIPVLLFFGALGAGAASLSLPTSLIGCIALGIAIDDTAHFLVGYRRRRLEGSDPETAAAGCVRGLGPPIVTTSVMLVVGFLVITLSEFATLRELGTLCALTMFLCLGADLLLLPAILVRART